MVVVWLNLESFGIGMNGDGWLKQSNRYHGKDGVCKVMTVVIKIMMVLQLVMVMVIVVG